MAIPQLPVELITEVISTVWHMPLSRKERITLMQSSALLNSTWADIFDLVSSRDVYIPSAAFCEHFIQRLCIQPSAIASPSVFRTLLNLLQGSAKPSLHPARSANLACRSLTIQIINAEVHPGKGGHMRLTMGGVLDSLLETLDAWSLAPNLRRLSIEYLDTGFDDIFDRDALAALPLQISHLDVRYAFSVGMPTWLVESLRKKQERRRNFVWKAPGVTRLSVIGAGKNTIRDLLVTCSNVKTVDGECSSVSQA
ncbi:hypothetical protein B0H14DRAFT_3142807 [Mycena olivaceomarginata]|nr:hypothetical protein B0H14DRAFT_3142807 [Mycena olivaceomarginata]